MMCPICGSTYTTRERCIDGKSRCLKCHFVESSLQWDELLDNLNSDDWQWKLITDTDAMFTDCVQKPILGSSAFVYRRKPKEKICSNCRQPTHNCVCTNYEPIQISSIDDLNELATLEESLTLNDILQDIQNKQMSVHAGELLIKAKFGIKEG